MQKRGKSFLLFILVLIFLLTGCSSKVKTEKINTKDYSREILLEYEGSDSEVIHADKSAESALSGSKLKSDDTLHVGSEPLTLNADGNKEIHAEPDSEFQMEASGSPESGKTRIHLNSGGLLINLEKALGEGELFQVQTEEAIVSLNKGIVRVSTDGKLTQIEVFEGDAQAQILESGETASAQSGSVIMIFENGKSTSFASFAEEDLQADGSKKISYEDLPDTVLEELLSCAEEGHVLSISEQTLENLLLTGHDFAETDRSEPSCTAEGTVTMQCTLCGETKEETLPALGHTPEEIPGEEPTCEKEGMTAGEKCTVCGEILTEQQVIPAAGHTEKTIPGREPTCSRRGLTDGISCAVCGKILKLRESIAKLEHTIEIIPGKEPTCTEDGFSESARCSVCGEILTEQQVIPAAGHTEKTIPGREPTCSRRGLTDGINCAVCGKILKLREPIAKLEHTIEVIPGKEPTCTEDGCSESARCSVCGEQIQKADVLPKTGHTPEAVAGVDATCTSTGLTEGKRCSVCGEWLEEQQEIEKLDHTPKTIHGIYAMCYRDGLTDGSQCAVCGEILTPQEVIPALPHTRGGLAAVEPTCSSVGWTEGLACQVCGYIMYAQKMIPKTEHTPEVIPAVAATCTESGLTEGSKCSVCGEILKAQEVIEPLGHTAGAQTKEMNPEDPELGTDGSLLDDENHHPYCYVMVTRCTVCKTVMEAKYFEHTDGEETNEIVGSEAICTQVSTACKECHKIIHKTFTVHSDRSTAEENGEDGNVYTAERCTVCSFLFSRTLKTMEVSASDES